MSSASTLIARASCLLNDQEDGHSYTGWSQAELLDYYNEAMCTLYKLRPDAFATCKELKLKPGAKQELPAGAGKLIDIDGNTGEDETSKDKTNITMSADDMVAGLRGKRSCANSHNCSSYNVQSWEQVSGALNTFKVSPPVPEGIDVTVDATVSVPPATATMCDDETECVLDCGFHPAIVDWILYRAHSRDAESQYSYNLSRRHQAAFYDMVNGGYLADSRMRSGYVLGEKGHGVETTGWRNETRNFGR